MKKLHLIISFSILTIMAVAMVYSVFNTDYAKAEEEVNYSAGFCTIDENNIYMNKKASKMYTEEIIDMYHETINDKFNGYIKRMIQNQTKAAEQKKPDPLSQVPEDGICDDEGKNYSAYCMAQTLLSSDTYGYMAYAKALTCRRYSIVGETLAKQRDPKLISGQENKDRVAEIRQNTALLEISSTLDLIDRELASSKRALDQTLAAYEELKTAWPMHVQYMETYSSLVKFRDKMAEIRHQVEFWPGKFIDATTTQCT